MWAPSKAKSSGQTEELTPYDFDMNNPNDLTRRAIDKPRPMKVIVLGAGMSGIIAGIFFPRSVQNLELVIYDKNPDLGGTWYESNYPGVACDVPSHAYQFTFESNSQWSSYWAGGAEIQAYLKHTAAKYGADKYMKFNHKLEHSAWDEKTGQWTVTFTKTDTGETITDTADVFISARGALNDIKMPDIPGVETFKGELVHSMRWKKEYDTKGKRVALIGGGSTGIQILPKIQPTAARVDHYMKGKTWIPPFGIGGQGIMERGGDPTTPTEDLKRFRENPAAYTDYRREIENMLHTPSDVIYKDTTNALGFQKMCEDHMKSKLAKKPEIYESLLPTFAPACRRLTPGPGYLEALVEDNVDFIPTGIKNITEKGIVTEDGKEREVDMIICATGFAGYVQPFSVIGNEGIDLKKQWEDDIPEAYLAVAPANMPNFFTFLGPNGGPGIGSTVPFLEAECRFMIKCVQKLQREWLKSMTPKLEAVKAFGSYTDKFLNPTVFNSSCRCWWRHKGNGRLLAIWPGSALHGMYTWENPRWEDFEYTGKDELKGDPFAWLGNGYVSAQLEGGNMTPYLDDAQYHVSVESHLENSK